MLYYEANTYIVTIRSALFFFLEGWVGVDSKESMINNPGTWMFEVLRMSCYFVATRDRADGKMQYGFGIQSESLREARFVSYTELLFLD